MGVLLQKAWLWLLDHLLAVSLLALALVLLVLGMNAIHAIAKTNRELGQKEADVIVAEFNANMARQEASILQSELDLAQARNQQLSQALAALSSQQNQQTQAFNEVINETANQDWRHQPVPNGVVGLLQ